MKAGYSETPYTSTTVNKDIRERAREMFDKRFESYEAVSVGHAGKKVFEIPEEEIKSFIDTIITETIKEERERIVGIIEKQKERANDDVDYRECCNDSIYLITNKSDINSNK